MFGSKLTLWDSSSSLAAPKQASSDWCMLMAKAASTHTVWKLKKSRSIKSRENVNPIVESERPAKYEAGAKY